MIINVEGLKHYNEKFEKIKRNNFYKYVLTHSEMGIEFNSNGKIIRNYPHEEACDAFYLNFRFFFLKKEPSSLDKLKPIYKKLPINEIKKKNFSFLKEKIDKMLGSYSYLFIDYNKSKNEESERIKLTWKDLMDAVIYGNASHINRDKKRYYSIIANDKHNKELLHARVIGLMTRLLVYLEQIYQLNKEVIDELEKKELNL